MVFMPKLKLLPRKMTKIPSFIPNNKTRELSSVQKIPFQNVQYECQRPCSVVTCSLAKMFNI